MLIYFPGPGELRHPPPLPSPPSPAVPPLLATPGGGGGAVGCGVGGGGGRLHKPCPLPLPLPPPLPYILMQSVWRCAVSVCVGVFFTVAASRGSRLVVLQENNEDGR